MGWILESNKSMNRAMEGMGGTVVRRYRLYERLFEDAAPEEAASRVVPRRAAASARALRDEHCARPARASSHADRRRCHDARRDDRPLSRAEPDLVEPEETVDGVPVLAAEVRALERAVPRRQLPAVQAAAVAATGFAAGAATVVAISRRASRARPAGAPRRRKRDARRRR